MSRASEPRLTAGEGDLEFADALALVETFWPYDGPHDGFTVTTAAQALPRLVRYLKNATGPWKRDRTLDSPSETASVLTSVASAAALLDQLLRQLAAAMAEHAADPRLYDDRHDRPAAGTALDAAQHLKAALTALSELYRALSAASRAGSHLGRRDMSLDPQED